jgi:hypothetical protein
LHSWNKLLLTHHMHNLDLLRLISEVRVDSCLQEARMGNLISMPDIESLKKTVNLHQNVTVLTVLVIREGPVVDLLEDL